MQSFKKVISLNQAARISGYTQDYLGFLMRNGDIKGLKKGRIWFTTEEDVKDYLFKKKIRQDKLAFGDFFSPTRTKNIIIITFILIVISGFFIMSNKNKIAQTEGVSSALISDGEAIKDN